MDLVPSYRQFTSVDELISTLPPFEQHEGYVTWANVGGTYLLTKFKTPWYLRLHALRSEATPRYMRELAFVHGVKTLEDLKLALGKEGFDWEAISYVEPLYREIEGEWERLDTTVQAVLSHAQAQRIPDMSSRKDIALACRRIADESAPHLFSFLLYSVLGEADKAHEIYEALRLNMTATQLRQWNRENGRP